MKRQTFLQGMGLAGIGTFLSAPVSRTAASCAPTNSPPNCVLIPSETPGPFPLDLTENAFYFRQDVREDRTGVQLNLKMKIIGLENCALMPNVRVNIWQCDRIGRYSGYQTEVGQTYLRGYQITDANGEVELITVFPGWYNGRICHIHFQCYVSSVYAAISQLTFPIAPKNEIYAAWPDIYTKGADPLTFNTDGVFADGYAYQLATLTPNPDTGGYDSYLEVTIQGEGTTGLRNAEPETGGLFTLGQNVPNPYTRSTAIPFVLTENAEVQFDFFDTQGKHVAVLPLGRLPAGEHMTDISLDTLGLPSANYVYQLQVIHSRGTFRQGKLMTAMKSR